ncbi:hypothetical protein BDA99DRAFT_510744 [Phascolomyces articulosus]|uniref:Uncharacterized protein n=1 Tax=Phascolomyces articulosus TaxID=60185 RepID=A0AAD5PDZ4_9FUNG|nr:hypothetical protein BDA99DRAFT_510744 [Phascolomyces articulosus]
MTAIVMLKAAVAAPTIVIVVPTLIILMITTIMIVVSANVIIAVATTILIVTKKVIVTVTTVILVVVAIIVVVIQATIIIVVVQKAAIQVHQHQPKYIPRSSLNTSMSLTHLNNTKNTFHHTTQHLQLKKIYKKSWQRQISCSWHPMTIVTRIINEVAEKTKTIRTAKLELLTLAASMEGGNKANVVEGVANLLTKLPRVEILNMDKLGEVELQTTYYDALLSELIADQDKNVALRWPNKSTDEEQTDIRPDAIVSTIMQHDFGYLPGNSSTTKYSVSLDVLRLGIASKRAIDKWRLNSCFGFMINGFDLTFFITKKQHKNCSTMLDIAQFTYASSLSNLHSFVSLMNLNKLTKVGRCFWNECHATHVTRDDEAGAMANDDAGVVPMSELYALISRTHNRTLGTSSRY